MRKRYPAVAGTFYEASKDKLIQRIEWAFKHPIGVGRLPETSQIRDSRVKLFISPHAGYMYSGPVASHTYYRIAQGGLPETVIIAGPNHTGMGSLVATTLDVVWSTPLGDLEVDKEFAKEIMRNSSYLDDDLTAHYSEHSIEVQLPFLQYIFGNRFKIIPIVIMLQRPEVARDLAQAIIRASEKLGRDFIYIASTDWTHYEPHEIAYKKDNEALKYVENLDTEGFYSYLERTNHTACGPGPTMIFIELAKLLRFQKAIVLKYATSGDVTGEKDWVVGYASVTAV
ncbi:MAG: AmmeMemoRadiSam system protein B [Sulfolobales archaeon]